MLNDILYGKKWTLIINAAHVVNGLENSFRTRRHYHDLPKRYRAPVDVSNPGNRRVLCAYTYFLDVDNVEAAYGNDPDFQFKGEVVQ